MLQRASPLKLRDLELLLIRLEQSLMLMTSMLANLTTSLKKLKKVEDKWTLNCTDAKPFQSSSSLKTPEEVTTKVVVAAAAMVAEAAVAAMEVAEVVAAATAEEAEARASEEVAEVVPSEEVAEVEEMEVAVEAVVVPQEATKTLLSSSVDSLIPQTSVASLQCSAPRA